MGNGPVPVNLPEREKGDSRDLAALAVGVSGKLVDMATKVLKQADPAAGPRRREGLAGDVAIKAQEDYEPATCLRPILLRVEALQQRRR